MTNRPTNIDNKIATLFVLKTKYIANVLITEKINDKTKLTVGFRSYDQDTMVDAKDGYFGVFDGVDKVFNSSDSGVVPKVNIAHNFNDDVMLYGSTTIPFSAGEYLDIRTFVYYNANNTGNISLTASLSYVDIEAITL